MVIVATKEEDNRILFNGHNWEDLAKLIALSKFQFLLDDDFDDNEPRRCAYLAQRFAGPALDWVTDKYASQPAIFESFDGLVTTVRQAFGVDENNIAALQRKTLDDLRWDSDTPAFFAEFDRLTQQLGIAGDETKINLAQQKMPLRLKEELARQALQFHNYETMRERVNAMWALDPHRKGQQPEPSKKPRCGRCGKRGHTATECRSKN